MKRFVYGNSSTLFMIVVFLVLVSHWLWENYVPQILTCPMCSRALRASVPHMLCALRPLMPHVSRALRTLVSQCLVPYVFSYLLSYLRSCFIFSVSYEPLCFKCSRVLDVSSHLFPYVFHDPVSTFVLSCFHASGDAFSVFLLNAVKITIVCR